MLIFTFIVYAVSVGIIALTAYTGILALVFYYAEIIKN